MRIKGLEKRRFSALKNEDRFEEFVKGFLAGNVIRLGWEGSEETVVLGNALGDVLRISVSVDLINDKPDLLLELI